MVTQSAIFGQRGLDRMVIGFTTTVQSVSITSKVESSNPVYGEVNSIQHYVIKFVSYLATGRWFYSGTPDSFTNKTERHDIAEQLPNWR